VPFFDPTRDVASYMSAIGEPGELEDFLREARRQSKTQWQPEYTAAAVNAYMRAGFSLGSSVEVAEIQRVDVIVGRHLDGSEGEVRSSDNEHFVAASTFSQNQANPFQVLIEAEAVATSPSPTAMKVSLEQRASTADAIARLLLFNWQTGQFDTVWFGAMGFGDSPIEVPVGTPGRYYTPQNGRILLRAMHTSLSPFSPLGFESYFDLIRIELSD